MVWNKNFSVKSSALFFSPSKASFLLSWWRDIKFWFFESVCGCLKRFLNSIRWQRGLLLFLANMVNLGFACLAYDITNFFLVFSFYGVDVLSLIWLLFLDKINKVIACLYPMAGETCLTWNSLYHDEENILGSKLLCRTFFFLCGN